MAGQTFFLSAAAEDHDLREVLQFERDLKQGVQGVLGGGVTSGLGWFLTGMWEPSLLEECRTAKVLVALLSPDYVDSEWCRREWDIFMERCVRATSPGSRLPWCIMNVWWTRWLDEPPESFRDIQWPEHHLAEDYDLVHNYRKKGLLYFQRHDQVRYQKLCAELGVLVAQAARLDLPPLEDAPDPAPPDEPAAPVAVEAPTTGMTTTTTATTEADPVARLLVEVPNLANRRGWEAMVKRIGERQGYYMSPFNSSRPLLERCQALVALLVERNGYRRGYGLVLAGLAASDGAEPAIAAIAAIIAGLPDDLG